MMSWIMWELTLQFAQLDESCERTGSHVWQTSVHLSFGLFVLLSNCLLWRYAGRENLLARTQHCTGLWLSSAPARISAWESWEAEPAECLEHCIRGLCKMLLHDECEVKHWLKFLNHTDSWKDSDKTPIDFMRNRFRPQVRVTKRPVTELEQKLSDSSYYHNKKIHLFSLYELKLLPFQHFFFFF